MPFRSYKNKTKLTREQKLEIVQKEADGIIKNKINEEIITKYNDLFNRFKNHWQEQQRLYRGKAVYECLTHMHDEIMGLSMLKDDGKAIRFAQYTYIYALQHFVRFLETFTPDDEFFCGISSLGNNDSLREELKKMMEMDKKYHYGDMDGFDPGFLEQLRNHYSSHPNLGLGHALDYSITYFNGFPQEQQRKDPKKAAIVAINQSIIGEYEDFFNQINNHWQEQQRLYRGKAVYECLTHMHDEIMGLSMLEYQARCWWIVQNSSIAYRFAQYTYIYALRQFVHYLKTSTPNDDLYRSLSDFGGQEKIIDDFIDGISEIDGIDNIGSLLKELRGLKNLELKYHFGNMNEFGPKWLDQLRERYPNKDLELNHAFEYSITDLKSCLRKKDTGIKAAFFDDLFSKIIKSWR